MKNKTNMPSGRTESGDVSLLCWENKGKNGKPFKSFTLNKLMKRRSDDDRNEFIIKRLELNFLSQQDLNDIKLAIAEMESMLTGVAL